jgi:hypothetical protein
MSLPEVTLFRRRNCGLCDDALFELRDLARDLPFEIIELDIDDDPELQSRYADVIPVIAVGDTEIAHAPIDPAELGPLLAWALGNATESP